MPREPLPPLGELTYNGVTFDELTHTSLTVAYERDEAGRVITAQRFELTVHGTLYSTEDEIVLGLEVEDKIKRLGKQGATLKYTGHGLGDIVVNEAGGVVRDVNYGPVPAYLTLQPIGGVAASIMWQVIWRVPVCDDAQYQTTLMAGAYSTQMTRGADGLETVVYQGYIEIPLTVAIENGEEGTSDNADNYRPMVVPSIPNGYQRVHAHTSVDQSKRILRFSFTDQMLTHPLPKGVIACDIKDNLSSSMKDGFVRYMYRLNVSCQVGVDLPKSNTLRTFGRILTEKLSQLKGQQGDVSVIPLGISFDDHNNGFQSAMSFTAMLITNDRSRPLTKVLQASGMWQPMTFDGYAAWAESMPNAIVGAYSAANLIVNSDNAVVSLCLPDAEIDPSVNGGLTDPHEPTAETTLRTPEAGPGAFMRYKNSVELVELSPVATHVALPGGPVGKSQPTWDAMAKTSGSPQTPVTGPNANFAPGPGNIITQVPKPSRIKAIMTGQASRYGREIPAPALLMLGNVVPVPTGVAFVHRWADGTDGLGVPIYHAVWRIEYELPESPGPGADLTPPPGDIFQGP